MENNNEIKRKAYLTELLVESFTEEGTPMTSLNEKLLVKAQKLGRPQEDAKKDVTAIMNLHAAIIKIIDKQINKENARRQISD